MRSLRFILAVACLAGPATAANTITFRTLCFRQQGDLSQVLATGPDGESMIEVPLYTVYSLPMKMSTRDGQAQFVVPDSAAGEDKPAHKPIANVKLPDSSEVLFLFLPAGKDAAQPYQVMALPDDSRSFPWGNVRMLNLANVPVRFHLGEHSGDQAILLPPGQLRMVGRVRKVNEFNMYNVVVEFQGSEGFIPVSNTRWKSVDGKRDLAIAFIDPDTRQPLVNVYKDVEPADAP